MESTSLFARSLGDDSDVVAKVPFLRTHPPARPDPRLTVSHPAQEMYTFEDRSGNSLTLRPENTAGVMRAVLQHNLHHVLGTPLRLWYAGPMFRYERPQRGRYRQFTQAGARGEWAEEGPAALSRRPASGAPQALSAWGRRVWRPTWR